MTSRAVTSVQDQADSAQRQFFIDLVQYLIKPDPQLRSRVFDYKGTTLSSMIDVNDIFPALFEKDEQTWARLIGEVSSYIDHCSLNELIKVSPFAGCLPFLLEVKGKDVVTLAIGDAIVARVTSRLGRELGDGDRVFVTFNNQGGISARLV